MKNSYIILLVIFFLAMLACNTVRTMTPSPDTPSVTAPATESSDSIEFIPVDPSVSESIMEEVNFFAGGAGCSAQNIGVNAGSCGLSDEWPIVLQLKGVFRVSNQGFVNQLPWWGDKFAGCYDTLLPGDMVYFAAQGFLEGESVEFIIEGPSETKTYASIVEKDIHYVSGLTCKQYATAPSARLSWVVDPRLDQGNYKVTVVGPSGKATLPLTIGEGQAPNFGVSVGRTSLPLVLGPERKVELVYSQFQPYQTVTTLLYKPEDEQWGSKPIRYIPVQMDENGSAVRVVEWDAALTPGKYWFLVPELVPDVQPNPEYQDMAVEPALWGVYFFADTPPYYDPDALYASTEDIFLRPSCGSESSVQSGNVINLRYGFWGANGLDLLEATKNKIITRLFINGEEVIGYRSNQVMSMSEMPCGNDLKNGYFLYSETQIGPYDSYSDPPELNITVEYSFTDSITDGYDVYPKDGNDDQYDSSSSFQQNFKIILQR